MISGDTVATQGKQGPFWNTLRGFHTFWDRIDILCPFIQQATIPVLFKHVFFYPLIKSKLLLPLVVFLKGLAVVRKHKPDLLVIHAYGLQLMSWGGWLLAWRTGLPFIVEIHHIEGLPKATNLRDYLCRIATVVFIKAVRRKALAFRVVNKDMPSVLQGFGVPSEKIHVIHSMYIDPTIFSYAPNIPKKYDIVFVGRLVPNKGLDLLIEAFKKLQEKFPALTLLIVGQGELEEQILLELRDCSGWHHTPFLPKFQDVAKAYQESKIVVCASYAEGGPRYVVEAMACGLPAVSTPVGLMKEIVRDHETGFLLKGWSVDEMVRRITELLEDEELYQRCSTQAQVEVAQFSYDRAIENYAMTYRRLVDS